MLRNTVDMSCLCKMIKKCVWKSRICNSIKNTSIRLFVECKKIATRCVQSAWMTCPTQSLRCVFIHIVSRVWLPLSRLSDTVQNVGLFSARRIIDHCLGRIELVFHSVVSSDRVQRWTYWWDTSRHWKNKRRQLYLVSFSEWLTSLKSIWRDKRYPMS